MTRETHWAANPSHALSWWKFTYSLSDSTTHPTIK